MGEVRTVTGIRHIWTWGGRVGEPRIGIIKKNVYAYTYKKIYMYMCTYVCIHILGNRDTQKMEQFSESKG